MQPTDALFFGGATIAFVYAMYILFWLDID